MSNQRDSAAAPTAIPSTAGGRGYHHGDLRNGLLEAARTILEEESLAALTLRAVARKAGVSHAAPYRHFPNHEALLVELSMEGFDELREAISEAAKAPGPESDKIATIGAAYMRFVVRRPELASLMSGLTLHGLVRAGDAVLLEGEPVEIIRLNWRSVMGRRTNGSAVFVPNARLADGGGACAPSPAPSPTGRK